MQRTARTTTRLIVLWTWRVWMLLYAAMAVAQPVLAGGYLSGSFEAIHRHGTNGGLLMLAALVAFVLAVLHSLLDRAVVWPAAAVVVLFVAQGLQIGLGYSRSLAIHLPLGVGIVCTVVVLTGCVWSRVVRREGWWARRLGPRPAPAPAVGATR